MKAIFGKIKKISKAFKDPNADYWVKTYICIFILCIWLR